MDEEKVGWGLPSDDIDDYRRGALCALGRAKECLVAWAENPVGEEAPAMLRGTKEALQCVKVYCDILDILSPAGNCFSIVLGAGVAELAE